MIGFRVDSNKKIGMGHLMRCIAIAKACEKKGMQSFFILADSENVDILKANKIDFCVLNTQWDNMDSEIGIINEILLKGINYLIVDSYYVTDEYLRYLEKFIPVMYVDDTQDSDVIYPVSAVLHYSEFSEEKYRKKYEKTKTKLLVGFDYVPLRQEFQDLAWSSREKSIMITTGSTDPYNIMGKVLEQCIGNDELIEYKFHVIVGSMNINVDFLNTLACKCDRIILHRNVSKMSEYMLKSQIAISAGGTTLYELCACRIPTIAFSFVDNQIEFTKKMGEKNILKYVGDIRNNKNFYKDIEKNLISLVNNLNEREKYADNMSVVMDRKGCERIADFYVREI